MTRLMPSVKHLLQMDKDILLKGSLVANGQRHIAERIKTEKKILNRERSINSGATASDIPVVTRITIQNLMKIGVLLKEIESGQNYVNRRTDRRTDMVKPVYPTRTQCRLHLSSFH